MITNKTVKRISVYDFKESIIDSKLPMMIDASNINYDEDVSTSKRCRELAQSISGSGHDCFLKGIQVRMTISGTQNFWMQWQRYTFADSLTDIVSSQSKMHRIRSFDIDKECSERVSPESKRVLKELIAKYDIALNKVNLFGKLSEPIDLGWTIIDDINELKKVILDNVPCGLRLTASISTNFLSLKTIVKQRKSHLLDEWQDIASAVTSLEEWEELFGKEK